MVLHEAIRLESSHDFFVFEANTPVKGDKLVINRQTGTIGSPEDGMLYLYSHEIIVKNLSFVLV